MNDEQTQGKLLIEKFYAEIDSAAGVFGAYRNFTYWNRAVNCALISVDNSIKTYEATIEHCSIIDPGRLIGNALDALRDDVLSYRKEYSK